MNCRVNELCTKNKSGRLIERSEYTPYIEQNRLNIEANTRLYKQRQAIVEHPYGIIKRQWGFYYIMTKKGMKRASADVGMILTAFNLRRLINLIDKNEFKKFLRELAHTFYGILALIKVNNSKTSYPIFYLISNTHFKEAA